jgi:DNA-binding GntR family transcriptional regulator
MLGLVDTPPADAEAKQTTQETAYQQLRHSIMVGEIRPGTSLTIRGLAAQFDLSPTPIREALRRLSSENAIEVKENRRIAIPLMTLERFEEIVSLRIAVECHAAVQAIPHVSNILINGMKAIDEDMDHAIRGDDLDRLTVLNHAFHRSLYTANPHQIAMPVVESIWLQLGPFQRQALHGLSEFYKVDRHKEVLRALKGRDDFALAGAIRADIRDGILQAGRSFLSKRDTR